MLSDIMTAPGFVMWLVMLVTAAACSLDRPGVNLVDGAPDPSADASADAPADAADAPPACMWNRMPQHFDPCQIPEPMGSLTLDMDGTYVYDTEQGMLFEPDSTTPVPHAAGPLAQTGAGAPEAWLASVDGLEIGAMVTLRVVGTRPLIIASSSDIVIASGAVVDASSSRIGQNGAGSNPMACAAHAAAAGEDDNGGGAGGGGGGFGGNGGSGGGGDVDTIPSLGGAGGMAIEPPAFVRGGCDGGRGGNGDENTAGTAGAGGGAIQLTAQTTIVVAGQIHAGGAGGEGGENGIGDGGAGGGGSGGYIGLDAETILIDDATLAANGGGGGEGSGDGQDGDSGDDATADLDAARGGSGRTLTGVNGGDGSAGQDTNGESVFAIGNSGGGGGGGGAGFILVFTSPTQTGTPSLSPPITEF